MKLFKHRIVLDDELMERVKAHVERVGFASVQEFVHYCIDKEISASGEAGDDEMHLERLRGLGYIE